MCGFERGTEGWRERDGERNMEKLKAIDCAQEPLK